MAVRFDYVGKPISFSYTYPTTVATASSSVPVATFVAPVDLYVDQVSMAVMANGATSGATEVSLSNNVYTAIMWAANSLQLANDSAVLYASLDRDTFNTEGLAKVDAGDRLLLYVLEVPGTASTGLNVDIFCHGA
jgi:hypothetical protein